MVPVSRTHGSVFGSMLRCGLRSVWTVLPVIALKLVPKSKLVYLELYAFPGMVIVKAIIKHLQLKCRY